MRSPSILVCLPLFFATTGACGDSASDAGGGGGDGGSANVDGGGGPDAGGAATDAGADATPLNPNPTISSWLGTNVSADLPRVDITHQLSAFDTPAAQKDPNGYPVAGASGTSTTDIGFVLPSGAYKVSYQGDGALDVSGIAQLTGSWQTVGNEHRATLQITGSPGAFGKMLTLAIKNAAAQSVHDVHLYFPGFDFGASAVFTPEFLHVLAPFRALRFMDWEGTNGSKLVDWADRPRAASFGVSPHGEPYEHIAELVNVTGKDLWLTVPEHVTDAFVHELAKMMAASLDFGRIQNARNRAGFATPFKLILENSNETWNNGFTAYQTFLDAAKADPVRYPGVYAGTYGPSWMAQSADLMKVGQYEADRLVKHATIFRTELAANGKSDVVAPVLSGWALGAAYSDVGLRFIKDNYGDPKKYVSYVAMAPYFGPEEAQTTALAPLFASAQANIASMDGVFKDFKKLVTEYGLAVVAYEGGQGISGNANLTVKHLAQHDQRMYDAYASYFALWKKDFGDALFMHFSLSGVPGLPENIYQYGFWGSIIGVSEDTTACAKALPTLTGTESVASVVHHCPKYRALAEQVAH
jgi:hypothetical protein